MNVFGALTILVAVFGAFGGTLLSAFLLRNQNAGWKWLLIAAVGLVAAYFSLKVYFWLLRKLDENAQGRKK
jgi:phosphotransferase system  glucose/maltose/N-acetylglucosamine-specific IIC component